MVNMRDGLASQSNTTYTTRSMIEGIARRLYYEIEKLNTSVGMNTERIKVLEWRISAIERRKRKMPKKGKWEVGTMSGDAEEMAKALRSNAAFKMGLASVIEGLHADKRRESIKRIKEFAVLLVWIFWTIAALLVLGAREFGVF